MIIFSKVYIFPGIKSTIYLLPQELGTKYQIKVPSCVVPTSTVVKKLIVAIITMHIMNTYMKYKYLTVT